MEEEDQDLTPFWLRSGSETYFRRSSSGGRSRTTATLQIVFFSFLAFGFIFFIVPQFASTASQIFRPHLVRKGWDSLNLVLVLFAIICGFLSRNTENSNSNESPGASPSSRSYAFDYKPSDPVRRSNQWYDNGDRYSDRTVVNRFARTRSMRSSSSYPDLRVCDSAWAGEDQRWRFNDDTRLYDYRFDRPEQLYQGYRQIPEVKAEEDLSGGAAGAGDGEDGEFKASDKLEEKEIYTVSIDTVKEVTPSAPPAPSPLRRSPSPPPRPPSPPPVSPPPPPVPPPPQVARPARRKTTKRVYQDLEPQVERVEKVDLRVKASARPPPRPQDLAQHPPPPAVSYERSRKNEKKRGGATKDFLIALRRKKKKQRQKSVENIEMLFESPSSSVSQLPPRTPPPPPPPPPPTFFHGLFSTKKGKSKRPQSTPPPPPPPPPRRSRSESLESRASIVKSQKSPMTWEKPKVSSRVSALSRLDDRITIIGNESPLRPIPPPPPPPPFKMPAWKYVVQGDYARLVSMSSSRSGSPDPDGEEDTSDDGGYSPAPPFCPSPDVDTKADNFISRFRAGLKLEKMNSVKEKHRGGKSNLGPGSGARPEPDPNPDPFEGEETTGG